MLKNKSIRAAALLLSLLVSFVGPGVATAQDVVTQHNDNQRTGANLVETQLTPQNVNKENFRLLYSREVDGYVYAQPLYVSKNESMARPCNLVIVATGENRVYAFNADDGSIREGCGWRTKRLAPAGKPSAFNLCPLTTWPIGITSTPVIDPATNRVYFVTRKHPEGTHWLHRIDLSNGHDLGTVEIKYDTVESGGPTIPFEPKKHMNRAGLLLVNGKVYIGFAAMCDRYNSHGWVFSYDANTLKRTGVFCTTPQAVDQHVSGGVWQSGNGIASDSTGRYIYLMTGNGEYKLDKRSFGSSFLQLRSADLSVIGYFAPNNEEQLSIGDVDLGSGGPVLLTDNLLIGGGKQGRYYVLAPAADTGGPPALMTLLQNRAADMSDHTDGFQALINTHHDPHYVPHPKNPVTPLFCPAPDFSQPCPFPQVKEEDNLFQVECARRYALQKDILIPQACYGFNQYYGPNIHGGAIFWKPQKLIFGTAEKEFIKSFTYYPGGGTPCNGMHSTAGPCIDFATPTVSDFRAPDGMPGGFLSLSANNGENGIIWASFPTTDNTFFRKPGRLLAFDALSLKQLWIDRDSIGFAKFCPPTVAAGKVFRAGFVLSSLFRVKGKLLVYGLNPRHRTGKSTT